jgi:NTP pyrophosphatase (non-canonical NTP hydrolase)
MTQEIDLKKYAQFVDGVTSKPSKDLSTLIARMLELEQQGADVSRLLTAGIGLPGEAGEFSELVKKIVFHGKDYNEENQLKLEKELGDVAWYWTQACLALKMDPNKIISDNVAKLEARYPGGKFSVYHAENRQDNDV